MPARTLTDEPTTIHPFDVLGQTDGTSHLMVHALLCNETDSRTDVTKQSEINCSHMGPPLGQRSISCDAVGSAELNDTHRRKIKLFVDDRLLERAAEKKRGRLHGLLAEYRIHPPATRPSQEFPLWRFSCVGYVLEAYKAAGIRLLGAPLPFRTLDELKQLYPHHARRLDDSDIRTHLGIGEGDRWAVALVGYVLNSLSRAVDQIHSDEYIPQPGDEYFPPEPPLEH